MELDFGGIPQPGNPGPVGRWFERTLNLNPGDLRRGALLTVYLFLIITTYVVGKVARDALFLTRFEAMNLPYADIATAVLVGFVVAACVRLGHHRSLGALLSGTAIFFSANCLLVWALLRAYPFAWLYPVFYIWVGIFGVLAPAQVWTLANFAFTTREARRIFGLVGSGAIAGWIFGGFFSRLCVQAFGTHSLLLAMALFLALSAVMAQAVSEQARGRTRDARLTPAPRRPHGWREAAQLFSSPYVRSLAALVLLSSAVTTLVGWQFKAGAQEFIRSQDALAIFFGNFNFYAGLLSLVVQLLVTSRLLRRFGTGPALFVVPIALLGGATGLLLTGSLAAVVALKASDQVLRYSIDRSAVELLYLPLPSRTKLHVKWFIDTVIWRFGDGIAGVAVLVLGVHLADPPRQLSWAVIAAITGWLAAAFIAWRRYGDSLADSIRRHRFEVEGSTAVLDRAITRALAQKIASESTSEVLYALDVYAMERRPVPQPAIRALLRHSSPQVRCRALALLAGAGDTSVLAQAEMLLKDPDLEVRTEALLFLCRHQQFDPLERIQQLGDFADFSIRAALAAYFARSGPSRNLVAAQRVLDDMAADPDVRTRMEAARLLRRLPDDFDALLRRLLDDPDAGVVREAILSAGRLRKRRLTPELLDALARPEISDAAAEALRNLGDSVVGALRDHLLDSSVLLRTRRRIPGLLADIGGEDAIRALEPQLLETDTILRYNTLSALNRILARDNRPGLDRARLESVLEAEVMGHYRSYQILHALAPGADHDLGRALRDSIAGERERIFGLLGLLYPALDFKTPYYGLQSKSAVVRDNALEFLETTLKPRLRELLVPLLDARFTIAERARLAGDLLRVDMQTREEAAAALVESGDPALRWCGAYAIGRFGLHALAAVLDSFADDSDPLLREAARVARARLGADARA